jgi:heterodisulfide reductase subunit C
MKDWGYTLNNNNQIDLDATERLFMRKLSASESSFKLCIGCGTCTGTCSTGNFTQFGLRKIISSISRDEINGLSEELSKCMACGKCLLVCPRGVNTRKVITLARMLLNEMEVIDK